MSSKKDSLETVSQENDRTKLVDLDYGGKNVKTARMKHKTIESNQLEESKEQGVQQTSPVSSHSESINSM